MKPEVRLVEDILKMDNVSIYHSNLAGKEERLRDLIFNPKGRRYFEVCIPKDWDHELLKRIGFVIRERQDESDTHHILRIYVNYSLKNLYSSRYPEIELRFADETVYLKTENDLDEAILRLPYFPYIDVSNIEIRPFRRVDADGTPRYRCYLHKMIYKIDASKDEYLEAKSEKITNGIMEDGKL